MPFNNRYCFLNGKIIELKKAGINPLDIGYMRGYALLEVLRTYNGKIFAFNEHYNRLKAGASSLKLKIPLSKQEIQNVIKKLQKINHLKDCKIKIVLSGGVGQEDLAIGPRATFFIYIEPLHVYPEVFYQQGVKLITINYYRQNPQIKLANYVEAIRYYDEVKKQKAHELLYVCDGLVYECSTSNIFFFKNKKLITPNHAVLPGVTRKIVMNLAKKYYPVTIRNVTLKELLKADEVFITSTTREIIPVIQIDKYKIGTGKVGEHTKFLLNKFHEYIKKVYFQ